MVVVPFAVIVLAVILIRDIRRRAGFGRTACSTALVVYLAAVVSVTLFPLQVVVGTYAAGITFSSVQIIPILTIDARTFLLNILLFVPLGLLLPLTTRFRGPAAVIWCGAGLSLGIELFQLATSLFLDSGRSSDVNDVIANTLGTAAGYGIFRLTRTIPWLARFDAQQDRRAAAPAIAGE